MASASWSVYRPSIAAPWNLARAWTLRRRGGFAATWAELERDLAAGPGAAVDRLLAGECRTDGLLADFASTSEVLGESAHTSSDIHRLQAWWLFRMLFTPDPLLERLTLIWHDHFATSQLKVDDVAAMRAQNETFRRHARGPFGDLLRAMLRDPALLIWLDAPSNRRGKPNENLARELMELFTLGVGHYTENDVKEAARALTGCTVLQGQFQVRSGDHDPGKKTILAKTAGFDADALAEHLLEQPTVAARLAWRLCSALLGEGVADASARGELADLLRRDDLHVGRAVATILRSEIFFSERNLHAKISEPVSFAVGAVRALERFDQPPSTLLLAEWSGRMGQELFFPPNVGGWPGGRSWLSGRTVVARANFASALMSGLLLPDAMPQDLDAMAKRCFGTVEPVEAIGRFSELLTGRRCDDGTVKALWQAARAGSASQSQGMIRSVALLLARPEAQLV
jgi:uncharacterized protein (DUF1800 family)